MLTWCTMPVLGGTTLNWLNASWLQRRKPGTAPGCAGTRSPPFLVNASGFTEDVGDHRVVDDQLGWMSGLIFVASPPRAYGLAHGSQVDDCRDAGQVLQITRAGVN